ncbi:ABC transporter ATP-binding protein [Pleomorphomonas sp. PLEO]|uniref:ABC transporter ATP-binding protein n=1 Tax=Pleomorphomonas sp. PLEO TaxID=3239306 RepID=UPI00351DCEA9
MYALTIAGLRRRFEISGRAIDALAGIDLAIAAGELLAVVGHSGCGKTTLLHHVAGLQSPDAGSITFHAPDGPTHDARIGMVFQEPRLMPWKTVRGNLALALKRFASGTEAERRIGDALDMVGLGAFADAWPHQLSGGMAQRVSLARALCRDPDILLLDEPFGALDALTRSRVHGEFAAIRLRRPLTTILVTHDIAEAVRLADRVAVMQAGRLTAVFDIDLPHPRPLAAPGLAEQVAAITAAVLGEPVS